MSLTEWMKCLEIECDERAGVDLNVLLDEWKVDVLSMYRYGLTPERAAVRALQDAGYLEGK